MPNNEMATLKFKGKIVMLIAEFTKINTFYLKS